MKVLTVAGARPQFIKAAVVSHVLRKKHNEVLVHTGQHYDYNMSGQFFKELEIPEPDYNLGISGGTHAQMTGQMMIALEEVLTHEKPDCTLVFGDTNSTLAAALASVKLHVPVVHVEAGQRTYSITNPEEINRICTDHVSTLLLTSGITAQENLKRENLSGYFTGNPMYDAFLQYSSKKSLAEIAQNYQGGGGVLKPSEYYYLTCHREENTFNDDALLEIFNAMEKLEYPVIYPVHPRNKNRAFRLKEKYNFQNIILTEPAGYLDNICLIKNARKIITDSGGVQTEAFFAEKKCVTVANYNACWPETTAGGRNILAAPDSEDILQKLSEEQHIDPEYKPFGDGHSAEKIVNEMERVFMKL